MSAAPEERIVFASEPMTSRMLPEPGSRSLHHGGHRGDQRAERSFTLPDTHGSSAIQKRHGVSTPTDTPTRGPERTSVTSEDPRSVTEPRSRSEPSSEASMPSAWANLAGPLQRSAVAPRLAFIRSRPRRGSPERSNTAL